MADVFISYTGDDRAAATDLSDWLIGQGLTVFYDVGISPGESWDARIEQELEAAKAVIVLWSHASVHRQWVRNEARFAMERGKLFPARLDDVPLPLEFNHVQTLALMQGSPDRDTELQTLLAAMARVLGQDQSPVDASAVQGLATIDDETYTALLAGEGTRVQLEARAKALGLGQKITALYIKAMDHALRAHRQLPPPTGAGSIDLAPPRIVELNAIEQVMVVRDFLPARLRASIGQDETTVTLSGKGPTGNVIGTGQYRGMLRNGLPHGFGLFRGADPRYGPDQDRATADLNLIRGDWTDGQLDGPGEHILSQYYEGAEMSEVLHIGMWRRGLRHGFGIAAGTLSRDWGADFLPLTCAEWRDGVRQDTCVRFKWESTLPVENRAPIREENIGKTSIDFAADTVPNAALRECNPFILAGYEPN